MNVRTDSLKKNSKNIIKFSFEFQIQYKSQLMLEENIYNIINLSYF